MTPFSVSLIITTYNWPAALELVLLSVMQQSKLPDEVIIADDGSKEETAQLIAKYQQHFPVPLIHSWQEDSGFRAARSRNLAIAQSHSDYIIMLDGDMILHRHFIRDHKRIAKNSYFTQGRRVILTKPLSNQLLNNNTQTITLFSSQVKNKLNAISCPCLAPLATKLLSKSGYKSARSCNLAAWYQDIAVINGFNEDFEGWGREDSEFVVRLLNYGVKRQDLRFGGVAYHVYHHENTRHNLTKNDQLLADAINNHISFCQNGLANHPTARKV